MKTHNKNLQLLIEAKSLHQANQLDRAKQLYLQVLSAEPNNIDALHLFGILQQQLKDYDSAILHFNKAMSLNAKIPQLHHNLGFAYKEKGDYHNAIACYEKALALNPNYAAVYEKLGNVYITIGEYQLAIDHYQQSLQLNPNNAEAWNNCGNAFQGWEMFPDAQECFEKALKIQPNFPKAAAKLGVVLKIQNKIEEALKYLKLALELNPDCQESYVTLCGIYDSICYWEDYQERQTKLLNLNREHIKQKQPSPISVLTAIGYDWPAADLLICAQSHSNAVEKLITISNKKINFTFTPQQKSRLKIGYISSDFHNHPVAHLTYNLYAFHDRSQFEIFGFSLGASNDSSHFRTHIAASCDHFVDLFITDDLAAAKKIYDSGIDILVDLNGHTHGNRMKILAFRPAPIQAHYLGFLGSMGSNFHDYILADEIVLPPAIAATAYSEKPVYLPYYQIFNNEQSIADKPLQRKDYNLPENAFVYCCHNSAMKIRPQIFSVWMEILAKTPNSVLWLIGTTKVTQENLRREAQQRNIDPTRLIFVGYEERSLYIARYRLADLFLDTPFYNANTTGSDALWAGLPLITTPTENLAGRGATSALMALGVPELIFPTFETYRDKAIYFYENRHELQKIREKIAKNKQTHLLFDSKSTVQYIEKAYWQMWEIFRKGESPRAITVSK